jgi:hypothetical protein
MIPASSGLLVPAFFIHLQFSFEKAHCFSTRNTSIKLWNPVKDAAFLLKRRNLVPNDVVCL